MAYRALQFTATIPANTPSSAPVSIALALDNWDIESIDLEVPPGPAGLMGFYIANNGVKWIPQGAGEFIVWDDRADTWYFSDQPNASGWAVVGYNLDAFNPHAVTVRFHVNLPPGPPAVQPVVFIATSPPATEVLPL